MWSCLIILCSTGKWEQGFQREGDVCGEPWRLQYKSFKTLNLGVSFDSVLLVLIFYIHALVKGVYQLLGFGSSAASGFSLSLLEFY